LFYSFIFFRVPFFRLFLFFFSGKILFKDMTKIRFLFSDKEKKNQRRVKSDSKKKVFPLVF